jgi:hypothetical protein
MRQFFFLFFGTETAMKIDPRGHCAVTSISQKRSHTGKKLIGIRLVIGETLGAVLGIDTDFSIRQAPKLADVAHGRNVDLYPKTRFAISMAGVTGSWSRPSRCRDSC